MRGFVRPSILPPGVIEGRIRIPLPPPSPKRMPLDIVDGDAVLVSILPTSERCFSSPESRVPPSTSSIANTACARHNPAMVLFLVLDVCALLLIGGFLRRYTGIRLLPLRFRSGSVKLIVGFVVWALLAQTPAMGRVGVAVTSGLEPHFRDLILLSVLMILSVNLILLGLIDVIGTAVKLIGAEMKR